jgi:lipopolysaccharide export system protein LptA
LKRVLATEAVHCVLAGQNGKKQTIDCSTLDMRTARSDTGKFYARQVNASGAVHAFDPEQDLRADTVALTLKPVAPAEKKPATGEVVAALAPPATQPGQDQSETAAVELEKMVARDNVLVVNKDGSSATGSELVVTTEDHQNHVRLTGSPTAMVVDAKRNTVVGPVITFEQGVAHVLGAGKMHLLQEQADGSKARPMDVAWIDHADMNGAGNRVDLLGDVSVTTLDADGTVNVAKGDKIHIDLIDKPIPATRSSTQPAPTTRPAHPTQTADSMQMGVMKDKDARTLTVDGNANVVSTLGAPDGTVLRQFALYGPKIIYQLADSKELPAKTLVVPSAGRMFVGDHRPPEQRKANAGAKDPGEDDNGGRGDTAFQWSKQLVYSESQRQATLTGDVVVVHQPLGKQAELDRVRINSDQVTAWFEPQIPLLKPAATQPGAPTTRPTTGPATQPTTRPGQPGESLQLKHLTSLGHVVITRATGATLYADRVDYDPTIHWMIARGNENNPARYVDPNPKPDALHPADRVLTALEMEWNTDTWNIKMSGSESAAPR